MGATDISKEVFDQLSDKNIGIEVYLERQVSAFEIIVFLSRLGLLIRVDDIRPSPLRERCLITVVEAGMHLSE